MVLLILRALFILLMSAVGWFYLESPTQPAGNFTWLLMAFALAAGVLIVCLDVASSRKKLAIFSGTLFGLIVGLFIAYALSFVVRLLVEQYDRPPEAPPGAEQVIIDKQLAVYAARKANLIDFIDMLVGVSTSYLAISFILQTKDDFRFIIPYVEFSKQTKGARPMLLDSSVLIDGRIGDVAATGIIESQLIVPRFIQDELQRLADSADKLIRAKGRRGLEILTKLKTAGRPELIDYDSSGHDDKTSADEDQQLIALAKELNGRVLTNDYNLNKLAQLRGVDVINLNELANAMKPQVMPGERMTVHILKPGEGPGQGVGYLDDGTMVVVEQGRNYLNEDVEFTVTNSRQTVQGRMIFGRLNADARVGARPQPPRQPSTV